MLTLYQLAWLCAVILLVGHYVCLYRWVRSKREESNKEPE